MKAKNTKERRNSFLKFLGLFLLTTATVVASIFFTYKVPIKENNILKENAEVFNEEMKFQNNFSKKMIKVKALIDSLDVPGQNIQYLNQLIGKDLVELQKSIPRKGTNTFKYDMYSDIVKLYVNIQDMKGKLRELNDAESTIEEYKVALEKSKEEFKQLERDLLIARSRR